MLNFAVFLTLLATIWQIHAEIAVDFDSRAVTVNGERTLLISGSVHYPRASASEWPHILAEAKENGINIIQTYVFWSIHEPAEPGVFYFPRDGSNADLVEFIQECQRQGLWVNLRFGPYVCAEWNFGGFPMWLKGLPDITFRTMDQQWLDAMESFVRATVAVVDDAKLLAKDDGPIIMAQIENEYGNMENSYGSAGAEYVQWSAKLADALKLQIPWIMCQQGEGVGSAPPAHVINTCNGYYCDNWIEQHTADFPNQPHMFTENWPGWFQNWGHPVPHRPAADVAFSVARWFARGGTYMNYYMAFGGTSFGRQVGGPLIITSYDYDVQINEYGMRAEPKFSLTTKLHDILMKASNVLLAPESLPLPAAVPLEGTSTCESHTYTTSADSVARGECYQFLSNWGERDSCTFPGGYEVPAWSVSILRGSSGDAGECRDTSELLNTKTSIYSDPAVLPANYQDTTPIESVHFSPVASMHEPTPFESGSGSDGRERFTADAPVEQLAVTKDNTDYLWYSVQIPSDSETGVIRFQTGTAGGGVVFAFVNGVAVGNSLSHGGHAPNTVSAYSKLTGASAASVKGRNATVAAAEAGVPVEIEVSLPASCTGGANAVCQLDLLSINMGVQNYGPFLESVQTGIVSDITWRARGRVTGTLSQSRTKVLTPVHHTVGLVGEVMSLPAANASFPGTATVAEGQGKPLQWFKMTFPTPEGVTATSPLALELVVKGEVDGTGEKGNLAMSKGAVWVNGVMLGRYWDVIGSRMVVGEPDTPPVDSVCDESCQSDQMRWVGSYSPERCVSGCTEPSQRFYKLPAEWLVSSGENTLVLLEEVGGAPLGVRLSSVVMKEFQ